MTTPEFIGIEEGNFLVFGHRGNPTSFPENTMISFNSAIKLGVDVVESDLRLTKDGVIVIHHDATINRISNGRGKVSDYSFDELQEFDAGYNFTSVNDPRSFRGKGVKIPALSELLEKHPGIRLNLDMKDKDSKFPQLLNELILEHDAVYRVLVGSFYSRQMRKLHEVNPIIGKIASLTQVISYYINRHSKNNFDVMQIPKRFAPLNLMTSSFIGSLNRKNIPVHVWTVNSVVELERMISLGVNGVFTNNPALCIDYLKRPIQVKIKG